ARQRIAPGHRAVLSRDLYSQELAGPVGEGLGQLRRDGQHERERVFGLADHLRYRYLVIGARPGQGGDTSRRPWLTARSMAARRLAQVPMRALCSPVATRALNSAQDRTDAALHCTLVCCWLNLTTSTAAAQRSHSTCRKPACRSSRPDCTGQPVRRAARFSATSASHSATARVVSTSNSKRAVISGVMSSTSV